MKKILVPTDFSPVSRVAGEYASYLAKVLDAEVHLMHAFLEIPVSLEPPQAGMVAADQGQYEYESLLKKESAFLKEKYLVRVYGHAVAGFTPGRIKQISEEIDPELIVIGAGRTASASGRKSKVPVLVIPEDASFVPLKHIVLAVDFHEITNTSCFDLLSEIVEKFDAMLKVVHIKRKGIGEKAAERGKLQLELLLSNVTFWYQLVESDDVDEGIRNFIESHPAELLVMVAHRHNILERIFGSIHTRGIVFETKLPTLILEDK